MLKLKQRKEVNKKCSYLKPFLKRNLTLRANGLYVAQASLSVKKKFRKFYVRAALTKEIIHASR